jgi:hypothetical protein
MPIHPTRPYTLQLACFLLLASMLAGAQMNPDRPNYSGMYSFLRDGEFVQITVEDNGHVIGFVSRYADPEGNGGFLDHFFKTGKLDANQLTFTTETVRGVSFEFRGTVVRGEGKSRSEEAYFVLKGALIENTADETKKISSRSQEVVLKSFPQDVAPPPPQKK